VKRLALGYLVAVVLAAPTHAQSPSPTQPSQPGRFSAAAPVSLR
jgi:hypothetical protein